MKCKRCRAQVPDDVDICPHCHEDLSSLRELLKNFYEEEFFDEEEKRKTEGAEEKGIKIFVDKDDARVDQYPPLIPLADELVSKEKLVESEIKAENKEKKGFNLGQGRPAGFWLRLMAFLIDDLILFFIFIIFIIIGIIAVELMPGEIREIPIWRLMGIILPALFPLACLLGISYFSFFHLVWGQTIGKMILGVRVVRIDGHPLSISSAVIRAIAYFFSAFPLGLGFLWVGFASSKRSWHDHIAGTVVIKE